MAMTRWRWGLLMLQLLLFALILVLPQVDLPDFTFHRGTAPVVAKAQLSSPPAPAVAALVQLPPPPGITNIENQENALLLVPDSRSLLSLLCVLLC